MIERHQENLSQLVESLRTAGHPQEVVRSSVHDLLVIYEADILAMLGGTEDI